MIRITFILLFNLLSVSGHFLHAQDSVAYRLELGYSTQGNSEFDYVLVKGDTLAVSWYLSHRSYGHTEDSIRGNFKIYFSPDDIPDDDDRLVYESYYTTSSFNDIETRFVPELTSGIHYLIFNFISDNKTVVRSNYVAKTILIYEYSLQLNPPELTRQKDDYETLLSMQLNLNVPCCIEQLGAFNAMAEVYLSQDDQWDNEDLQLTTLFFDEKINNGNTEIQVQESIYQEINDQQYDHIVFKFSSLYFSKAMSGRDPVYFSFPLAIESDIENIVASRKKVLPFLSYGSYHIHADSLFILDYDRLLAEASRYYSYVIRSAEAIERKDYVQALSQADSAFQLAGQNRHAILFYGIPGLTNSLYVDIISNVNEQRPFMNDSLRKVFEVEKMNMRAGEADHMGTAIREAYDSLTNQIFSDEMHEDLSVEDFGLFEENDPFIDNPYLDLPVLWRGYSLNALNHFTITRNFEDGDLLLSNIEKHYEVLKPLADLFLTNELEAETARYLFTDLFEFSFLMDYFLGRMEHHLSTGNFLTAEKEYKNAARIFNMINDYTPYEFWNRAAFLFEQMQEYVKADSLYTLSDQFLAREINNAKADGNRLGEITNTLNSYNSLMLKSKLGHVDPATLENGIGKEFSKLIIELREVSMYSFMKMVNNRDFLQKCGFLYVNLYPHLYKNAIEQLEVQEQYFIASELKKDLAFFVTRDNAYELGINLYMGLFPFEMIMLNYVRASFNEEHQILYLLEQQKTLSRYLTLLNDSLGKVPDSLWSETLHQGFQQTLFQHSFILRGYYRLMYNMVQSQDTVVNQRFVTWQMLKQELARLYATSDKQSHDIRVLKEEIRDREKELIRMTRDTSTYMPENLPDVAQIRSKLNSGEAAIEIIRYNNNQSYYGNSVGYGAFVVRKDSEEVTFKIFPNKGNELEKSGFHFYRNGIQFKVRDDRSYSLYWKPLEGILEGIDKVYFAPDGVFHSLNVGSLYNTENGKYVSEDHDIHFVTSISLLPSEDTIDYKTITLFGNPEYQKGQKSTFNGNNDTRAITLREPVKPLPGTLDEIHNISETLTPENLTIRTFTGTEASKMNYFEYYQSDVLHIATHGFWNQPANYYSTERNILRSLSNSGLLLSGVQHIDGNEISLDFSGILTATEIQDLYMYGTDLVVLSACETGLGEVIPGQGVYGLKRAFQKAGVKNIVTSLWKVDDTVTSLFMTTFYQTLAHNGKVRQAFHQAREKVKSRYSEPYYWSAFTLTSTY